MLVKRNEINWDDLLEAIISQKPFKERFSEALGQILEARTSGLLQDADTDVLIREIVSAYISTIAERQLTDWMPLLPGHRRLSMYGQSKVGLGSLWA